MYCVFLVQGSEKVLLDMFFKESDALSYVDKVKTWKLHGSILVGFLKLGDIKKFLMKIVQEV